MSKTEHLHMPENLMEEMAYSSRNPLIRFVHLNRLDAIVKQLPRKKGLKILDAGCGEGHLIKKAHCKNNQSLYFGVDITKVALKKAKERCPYAKFIHGDLTKIPYENESFDIVICTEVLEHIYEYKDVIKELTRVLRKNGWLIITFPNETVWTICRGLLLKRPLRVPDHVNSFTPRQIISLARLRLLSQINLPFGLPFSLSLGCLLKFKK
ncbi:MAG: class I SAM-dependent methyltransferase [Nanoarchaeota archaeon]|nr:class I SAM-dependent methyltransferase [Nanoarchaeota archaeon]